MIYTSYLSSLKNGKGKAISIMRHLPTSLQKYNIVEYPLLAPSSKLLRVYKDGIIDEKEYTKIFNKYLDKLDCDYVYNTLMTFAIDDDITLYCCEKFKDEDNNIIFCHRHIVAEWFRKHGYKCGELLMPKKK